MSVNKKEWLVMHMHVQLKLDELRGLPNPWLGGRVLHCIHKPIGGSVSG